VSEATVKCLLCYGFWCAGKATGEVNWCWWRIDMPRNKCFLQFRISHVLCFISLCDLFTHSLSYINNTGAPPSRMANDLWKTVRGVKHKHILAATSLFLLHMAIWSEWHKWHSCIGTVTLLKQGSPFNSSDVCRLLSLTADFYNPALCKSCLTSYLCPACLSRACQWISTTPGLGWKHYLH
jgi:hypothetical protein